MKTDGDNPRRSIAPALLAAFGLLAVGCADLTYDATPPYVAVLYPVTWSTLDRDTIDIRADAYDNRSLDRVVFFVDGESIAAAATAPFNTRWYPDTTGGHTIHCVAWDKAGNEAHTSPSIVTVTAPAVPHDVEVPFVALVRPAAWSIVHDTTRIEVIASDNVGVAAVGFFLDGDTLATLTAQPWVHFWDSRSVGNGYHTIYATAADSSGNRAFSAVVTIDVQNAR